MKNQRVASLILLQIILLFAFNNCGRGGFQLDSQTFSSTELGSSIEEPGPEPAGTVAPSPTPMPTARATVTPTPPVSGFQPKMGMLFGANGSAGTAAKHLDLWKQMGLRFSRVEISPKGDGSTFSNNLDANILANNANGISTLVLLAYAGANSSRAGDDKSAPLNPSLWSAFIESAVKYYSSPPFNVKHFQIWNEAAGKLICCTQATFWHSPTGSLEVPYADAMQDYVNKVHIPAAKMVRKYGAYVVYGGWPDQGGVGTYQQWLEYKSPSFNNQTMLDWTDYLDMHYLGAGDMETVYKKYVATGKIRGVWQSEVGYTYMNNVTYLPSLLFNVAVMALNNGWNDADQFVIFPYHWYGAQAFMLTDGASIHVPGISLETTKNIFTGTLAKFPGTVSVSAGSSVQTLYHNSQIIFKLGAASTAAGMSTITATVPAPANGYTVTFKDVVYGKDYTSSIASSSWSGSTLTIRVNVPSGFANLDSGLSKFMGYVIVTPK